MVAVSGPALLLLRPPPFWGPAPRRRRASVGLAALAVGLAGSVALLLVASAGLPSGGGAGAAPGDLGFLAPPAAPGAVLRGTRAPSGAAAAEGGVERQPGDAVLAVAGLGPALLVAGAVVVAAALAASRGRASALAPLTRRRAQGGKKVEDFKVGETVDGRVTRVAAIGIWVEIGADKEALWPKAQLPPDAAKYTAGATVKGLQVTEVLTGEKENERKLRVTLPAAASASAPQGGAGSSAGAASGPKVGDKYDGKVTKVGAIGIYVDIGTGTDALWPKMQLPEDYNDKYKVGDVVPGLVISEVSAQGKIRVSLKAPIASLKVGDTMEGKVTKTTKFGAFFDVGGTSDALAPSKALDKPAEDYKVGEKVMLKVIKVEGDKVTVSTNLAATAEDAGPSATAAAKGAAGAPASVSSFKVGQSVSGTVSGVSPFGVFINVGAERDALCRTNQLEKAITDYKVGDKIENLKVSNVDLEKNNLEVSSRRLVSEVKVGEKLEGTVLAVTKFGVFFDAGLATDVLVPMAGLSKPAEEYEQSEVADLIISTVQGSRITATTRTEAPKADAPKAKSVRGSTVKGTIKGKADRGLYVDVGDWMDAFVPKGMLPKPLEMYEAGEQLEGLIVTIVDPVKGVLEAVPLSALQDKAKVAAERVASGGSAFTTYADLAVGTVVEGKVSRVTNFGLFVDIGGERDALWEKSQVDGDYKEGDIITGLRVVQSDPEKQRLAVSKRQTAADFKVGQAVPGKVTKIMPFGVFVNIGASTEALAPAKLLAKQPTDYAVGDDLTGLTIAALDTKTNKISVGQLTGKTSLPEGMTRLEIDDLEVGQQVKGVVRMVKEYGIFMDIGVFRKDALLPAALLGDKSPDDFQPNQMLEVYISNVDSAAERVTLSLDPPSLDKRIRGGKKSDLPDQCMYPDPKIWAERVGNADLIDEEGVPWEEWAVKYPGLVAYAAKETELYLCNKGLGFSGLFEASRASVYYLPVPLHLRKEDAGPPVIPKPSWDDRPMGYDYGIKPEIHTKYRTPPLNDPNWTYRSPNPDALRAWRAQLNKKDGQEEEPELVSAEPAAEGDA